MSDTQEYTCHFCGNKITDEECKSGTILQGYTVVGLVSYCSKCREIGELIIKEYNKQSRKMDLTHEYYDSSELFNRIERIHKYKTGTIQIIFDNTGYDEQLVKTPILKDDVPIGVITEVTPDKVIGFIWERYLTLIPEQDVNNQVVSFQIFN